MWVPPLILSSLCILLGVFAYQIPLRHLIIPVFSRWGGFIGTWLTLKTTLFLFIGLGLGLVIYLLGNFKALRVSDSYIGGEKPEEGMRLSGTEFYNTVKEYGLLKGIYKKAEAGVFDIYEQFKNIVFGIGRVLQYLHNGVLPTYLVWTLLGMMLLFYILVK
jgi:hypothetical protein